MLNRSQYFIRAVLQTSKINREKFVKNKKIYNESLVKNRQNNINKIIVRKFSTYNRNPPFMEFNGPNPPNGNNIIYMIIAASGVYISSLLTGNNKKK
jgi:hypothetical protein